MFYKSDTIFTILGEFITFQCLTDYIVLLAHSVFPRIEVLKTMRKQKSSLSYM